MKTRKNDLADIFDNLESIVSLDDLTVIDSQDLSEQVPDNFDVNSFLSDECLSTNTPVNQQLTQTAQAVNINLPSTAHNAKKRKFVDLTKGDEHQANNIIVNKPTTDHSVGILNQTDEIMQLRKELAGLQSLTHLLATQNIRAQDEIDQLKMQLKGV